MAWSNTLPRVSYYPPIFSRNAIVNLFRRLESESKVAMVII